MLIKRILSKNVISVSVPGNRYTALDLMKKENVSVVPVTKGDTNNAKDVFNMFQNCSDILVAKIKNKKINIKYQAFIDK